MTRFTLFSSQLLPSCPLCGTVAIKTTDLAQVQLVLLRVARPDRRRLARGELGGHLLGLAPGRGRTSVPLCSAVGLGR